MTDLTYTHKSIPDGEFGTVDSGNIAHEFSDFWSTKSRGENQVNIPTYVTKGGVKNLAGRPS